jgi:hypothetical protein
MADTKTCLSIASRTHVGDPADTFGLSLELLVNVPRFHQKFYSNRTLIITSAHVNPSWKKPKPHEKNLSHVSSWAVEH